ncbi:type I-E CRISPR-associated protein Cas7/Cse4/CasC [Pigmentiphaga sp. NML080357]|uniref:type I-E CRISPR-associated protein Cas7/Cse4/CasC n=1 Tax=Pigmentiphaga sp. NML080357 TaxID=2008675 RepID=UPI000B41884D|nr:type I-E CRISPR-associated protein Cas7/Cse4/CasC [Pigmentiphaga sp. NML080357]OVZ59072.1 type I-E CRISPR-associated protein Cas7/Cse4/CasC [Pigmentiphaga sp. NML080357]
MSDFIQLHILTHYAPANLNRDDTGRPKTALMGGALRLRVSSQSLKRAWRTSDLFEAAVGNHLGKRTRLLGKDVYDAMLAQGLDAPKALEWARQIAAAFGSLEIEKPESKKKKSDGDSAAEQDLKKLLQIKEIVHVSPAERQAALQLAANCVQRGKGPEVDELKLLSKDATAVDVSMFGRMLASASEFNVEAAVQVAHAFTVHRAEVEDDYFSAVDDLDTDTGAGHIGERGYGAGLFYLYVCVNRTLLQKNLQGDKALANRAMASLLEAITKVSPTGMQNSYASRAYAAYVLAEKGTQQPRSLSQAFLRPVRGSDDRSMLTESIASLQKQRENFDKTYGPCSDACLALDTDAGTGSLQALIDFIQD